MRGRIIGALCLAAALAGAPAFADDGAVERPPEKPLPTDRGPVSGPESDPADAVKIAAAAFEYRDFQRVVDLLGPWVHPPRIADPRLMLDARRLLGLSYHVLGQLPAAREEFAQLLLQDPQHRLDPFTVPPKVIETFEAVKKEMKPTLDRILAERGQRGDPVDERPSRWVAVEVPSRWVTFLPGGVPQFVLDDPEWGVVLGAGQLLGLAANLTGALLTDRACAPAVCDDAAYRTGAALNYAGLGVAISAYVASVVLGNVGYEAHRARLLERAKLGVERRGGGAAGALELFF